MVVKTRCTDLKVGDMITEVDTPDGPFYPVIKVNPKSIVVDANALRLPGDEDDEPLEPLPLRMPIRPSDVVLLRTAR